jgi:hypothetical protein
VASAFGLKRDRGSGGRPLMASPATPIRRRNSRRGTRDRGIRESILSNCPSRAECQGRAATDDHGWERPQMHTDGISHGCTQMHTDERGSFDSDGRFDRARPLTPRDGQMRRRQKRSGAGLAAGVMVGSRSVETSRLWTATGLPPPIGCPPYRAEGAARPLSPVSQRRRRSAPRRHERSSVFICVHPWLIFPCSSVCICG